MRAYLIVDDELYGPTPALHKIVAVEETIEALEKAVGFPESTLTATVEFFNRHAANGEDPLFHKAPKYLRPLSAPPYSSSAFTASTRMSRTATAPRTRKSAENPVMRRPRLALPAPWRRAVVEFAPRSLPVWNPPGR